MERILAARESSYKSAFVDFCPYIITRICPQKLNTRKYLLNTTKNFHFIKMFLKIQYDDCHKEMDCIGIKSRNIPWTCYCRRPVKNCLANQTAHHNMKTFCHRLCSFNIRLLSKQLTGSQYVYVVERHSLHITCYNKENIQISRAILSSIELT